jgi:hypothetical protein
MNKKYHAENYPDIVSKTLAIWIYVKDSNECKSVVTLDDITPEATEEKQEK